MRVHGGYMDRSFSRFATLTGAAAVVGMLMAGCSSAAGGTVIGVPLSATAKPAATTGDALTGLQKAIAAQLAAVNATQTDPLPGQISIELDALTSVSNLVRAENFEALQANGAKEIAAREHILDGLSADVEGDSYLNGVDVSGGNLRSALMAVLEGSNSQLEALANEIAAVSLPDELRADVISINTSTRVYGVIEPMVHLALAGGDELSEVNTLAGQEQRYASTVAAGASTDPNYSRELALVNDLSSKVASARQSATAALGEVLRLTPAEFPSTKTTILGARGQLIGLRAQSGALTVASNDLAQIVTLLGDR
jgi:hypothetical protein